MTRVFYVHYHRGKSIVGVYGKDAVGIYTELMIKLSRIWMLYKSDTLHGVFTMRSHVPLLKFMEINLEKSVDVVRCHLAETFIQEVFGSVPMTGMYKCIYQQLVCYYEKLKLTRNMSAESYLSLKAVRAEMRSYARETAYAKRASRVKALMHMR